MALYANKQSNALSLSYGPLPNEGLYLLLQVIAFRYLMSVISVENDNIYPWTSYWDLPSICWGMSRLLHLWSASGLDQSGYSRGWSYWTSLSGVWIVDHLFYLPFLPSFSPYLVGLPLTTLSSWASPRGPKAHLQHSCTWWPYKVHLTWFSGHSCIRRIE